MTTLPIEKKKPLQYYFFNTNSKQLASYEVTQVYQDIIVGSKNNNIPIYVLNVSNGKNEFLVYLDKNSREILKTVFVAADGSSFVKEVL